MDYITTERVSDLADEYGRISIEYAILMNHLKSDRWGARDMAQARKQGVVNYMSRQVEANWRNSSMGFDELRQVGRLDLTTEALVLDPRFTRCFPERIVVLAFMSLGLAHPKAVETMRATYKP